MPMDGKELQKMTQAIVIAPDVQR